MLASSFSVPNRAGTYKIWILRIDPRQLSVGHRVPRYPVRYQLAPYQPGSVGCNGCACRVLRHSRARQREPDLLSIRLAPALDTSLNPRPADIHSLPGNHEASAKAVYVH